MSTWLIVIVALGAAAVTAVAMRLYQGRVGRRVTALADSDLQYRTVLESTSDSIITVNADAQVVGVNAAATRAFGADAPAFLLLGIDELIPRVVGADSPHGEQFANLLNSRDGWTFENVRVIARGLDSREFPAEVSVAAPSRGDVSNRLLFVREITARVKAENALQESEAKFRGLFEQMVDGVYRCCADGTFLDANPAMVRILGYTSEAELCRFENALDMCRHVEQRKEIWDRLSRDGEVRDMALDVIRKNGSSVTVLANIKPIVDEPDGEPVYQGTISDISKLRAATDALRDSEEHFRALAENSLDIVTIIDASGTVLYSSPSCLGITGIAQKEVIGTNVYDAVHRDDVDEIRAIMEAGFASPGTPKSFVCRALHADGSILHMESICSAFRNARGELRAVVNTRDITERLRTERQLQHAQKLQAVGQLTGGVAHDFNNLLTVIVSNLQLIEEAASDPETQIQVETALGAALQGADLTRSLLAFARRQPLEPKVIDVNELLNEMEPLLQRSLGKLMSTNLDFAGDLWSAKVDPTQLESAILNLAINARDAMGGQGELRIRSYNSKADSRPDADTSSLDGGDYVCIVVEDSGHGMTDEVRRAAIEPFFSTKEDGESSGLGLSMVYGFVRQSGGHMQLESEPEKGTRVEIYLPRAAESASVVARLNGEAPTPGGAETVLVVDDNAIVRNSAVAMLTRMGYEVLGASSGSEALEALDSSDIALLFSDVRMPEMTGFELAARAQASHPHLRVLLTSGFANGAAANQDDENRFEFIPKPYKKHDLATKIRTILDDGDYE